MKDEVVEMYINGLGKRYAVNIFGDVISYVKDRKVLAHGIVSGRPTVCIRGSTVDKPGVKYVAHLVSQAFLPVPASTDGEKWVLMHKDENFMNCRVDNLEWITWSAHVTEQYASGGKLPPSKPPTAVEIDYMLKGVGDDVGHARYSTAITYLTEEDLTANGIPPEYLSFQIAERSLKNTWEAHKALFGMIDTGASLKVCAKACGVDQSYVSLVRRGIRLAEQRAVYDKYVGNASY